MRCVNCGTELIPGKQFCHACGTRAVLTCTSCGSTVESGFRFCPECGAPIAGAAPGEVTAPPAAEDRMTRLATHVPAGLAEKIRASQGVVAGERKLVTVMFADLVGSTAIAEQLDPEEYRDLLEEYLAIAFDEVYRVEGIVNQLAGDGVMALFGAPIAHEDAPHRAIHAALALRDRLLGLEERMCRDRGICLQARIGVHTGPVVVGAVGNDLKMDYTAIGDTTNLAARLQTAAAPGTVLVSEATHRLVRGFFEFADERQLSVKGKTAPVVAYEVRGPVEVTTPMAIAEARGLTPLVARDEELAQILACYERLAGHLAQLVAVVGEAGSGKSRLLYEIKQRVLDAGAVLFEARCSALMQNVPYTPWMGMLRTFFDLGPDASVATLRAAAERTLGPIDADLEAALPSLAHMLLPAAIAHEDGDDDDERKRIDFEAFALVVGRAGKHRGAPVVMMIEDLHWIDEPSREMLDLAVGRIPHSPVMLLVSHRPEYRPTWHARLAFTQLHLGPLSDDDTTTIMRAVAGGPLPTELEAQIRRKAEGNPFFTEEITRNLIEEGHLLRGDGHTRLARPVDEVRLPGTIEELIGARLDRLGAHAKRVVQVASVLGRQFHSAQLAEVLAGEGIDVAAELDTLERRGIIHRKTLLSLDEYRFGESVTQEVAYGGLLLRQRRELHERIGALLERLPGDRTAERWALVAHHFQHGERPERAAEALLGAAQESERAPSYPAAARFYGQAFTLAQQAAAVASAPEPLLRLLSRSAYGILRMAVIYGATGEVPADHAAERGRAVAAQIGDEGTAVDILGLHGMLRSGQGRERFGEAMGMIEEGLARAEAKGLALPALRLGRARAWALLFDGRFDESRAQIERVITGLTPFDDLEHPSDVLLGARFMRDWIHLHSDALDRALATASETFATAVRIGNRTVQAGAATIVGHVHLLQGRPADALTWAERALTVAAAIGNQSAARVAGAVAVLAGRAVGDRSAERHEGTLQQGGAAGTEVLNCQVVVEALLAIGAHRRAEEYARAAYQASGGRLREASAAAALGRALTRLGATHWAEADQWFDRAITLAQDCGARSTVTRVCIGMGQLAAARGDHETAARRFETARTIAADLDLARYQQIAERPPESLGNDVAESA